jgi:hypothetical protein
MGRSKNKTSNQKKLSLDSFDYLSKILTKDQFDRFTAYVPIAKCSEDMHQKEKAIYAVNFIFNEYAPQQTAQVKKEDLLQIEESLKDIKSLNTFKDAIKPSKLSEIYSKIGGPHFRKKEKAAKNSFNFEDYGPEARKQLIKQHAFAEQQVNLFTDLLRKKVYRKKIGTLKLHPEKTHLIRKKVYPEEEYTSQKTLSFSCLSPDNQMSFDPDSVDHAFWLSVNGFKVCHFSQAVTTYATRAARASYNSLDFHKENIFALGPESKNIFDKISSAKKSFSARTADDVEGLQFYVFDFDCEISLDEIFKRFEKLGLYDAIRVVVQTSPNKYHVYLQHEFVSSWDTNFSYNLFYYKMIADYLGADTQACLPTGIYQTPGFINPKSNYMAHICYSNTLSKVLDLMQVYSVTKAIAHEKEAQEQKDKKNGVTEHQEKKPTAKNNSDDLPTADILNSNKPVQAYLNFVTSIDPNIGKDLLGAYLSKNITGKRNDILLKLFRCLHLVFDLTNQEICQKISDKIIYPFFEGCISNALNGKENRKIIQKQVRSLFETNKRKIERGLLNKPRKNINRESLSFFESLFEAKLKIWKKEGRLKGIGRPSSIAKALYARLDLATEKCAFKRENSGMLFVEAFTPVEELKEVFRHHYRYKNFLEKIYITDGKTRFPLFQLSNFYRFAATKGCGYSKHFLIAIPVSKEFWLELDEKPKAAETLYDKKLINYKDLLIKICDKKVYSFFSANKPRTLRPKKTTSSRGPPINLKVA